MVSLERARELGDAIGMPARRTQSEAFRVVANNPGVARVAFGQLMQLLESNKFDTRLRELMIMRIGWVTGSAYEWTQHWRVATTAGILFVFVSTLRIGAFRTALIMNLEPLTATLLSALVLSEVMTPLQAVGGVTMLAALVAFQLWK